MYEIENKLKNLTKTIIGLFYNLRFNETTIIKGWIYQFNYNTWIETSTFITD